MKSFVIYSSLLIIPAIAFKPILEDYISQKSEKLEKKKDSTRINSNSYGLEWGSLLDENVSIILFRLKES